MKPVRVVLHAHSTWSYDGRWPLNRIAKTYGRFGAGAVMMSEHDTGFDPERFSEYRAECAAASTDLCQLIPGIEYSSPENDIHILTWGLSEFLGEHRPVIDTLHDVKARGGVAVLAHPIRRDAWSKFDPDWVPFLSGIELWNRKSDGICWGVQAAQLISDTKLPATVGQDFHRGRQIYPLTMKVQVDDENLETGLVKALAEGTAIPQAFRRSLLTPAGAPNAFPHVHLERARQKTLRLLRRGKRKN